MTLKILTLPAAKVAKQVHWWMYDGSYHVACGKQYSQGDQPLKSTVDIKQVTCRACLRVHKRKTGGNSKDPFVQQLMNVVK